MEQGILEQDEPDESLVRRAAFGLLQHGLTGRRNLKSFQPFRYAAK